jgi:hypothetical protein
MSERGSVEEEFEIRQTRAGIGQSIGREGNQRNHASRPSSLFAEYGCECSATTCEAVVSLTVDEYEELRSVPTRFVVARGHVDPIAEFVVRESSRYQIVEKVGIAADVATRLDPSRSDGHRGIRS